MSQKLKAMLSENAALYDLNLDTCFFQFETSDNSISIFEPGATEFHAPEYVSSINVQDYDVEYVELECALKPNSN